MSSLCGNIAKVEMSTPSYPYSVWGNGRHLWGRGRHPRNWILLRQRCLPPPTPYPVRGRGKHFWGRGSTMQILKTPNQTTPPKSKTTTTTKTKNEKTIPHRPHFAKFLCLCLVFLFLILTPHEPRKKNENKKTTKDKKTPTTNKNHTQKNQKPQTKKTNQQNQKKVFEFGSRFDFFALGLFLVSFFLCWKNASPPWKFGISHMVD